MVTLDGARRRSVQSSVMRPAAVLLVRAFLKTRQLACQADRCTISTPANSTTSA